MDPKDKLTKEAQAWSRNTVKKLKGKFDELGIEHRAAPKKQRGATEREQYSNGPAKDKLGSTTSKKYGMVNRIRFRFPRHMVFVHKGVSRGHTISNPRKAKEWFNPVIESEIDKLADAVAENSADMVMNAALERLMIR